MHLYDTWYFSHRGWGYLHNYCFYVSLMNKLLFFEWKLCIWRKNFLPPRAICAFTWSAMLIFLPKMPHGIKVCWFQSVAVVHPLFCLAWKSSSQSEKQILCLRILSWALALNFDYRTLLCSRISPCPTWRFMIIYLSVLVVIIFLSLSNRSDQKVNFCLSWRSQSNESERKINPTHSNSNHSIAFRLVRQSNIIEQELFVEFDFRTLTIEPIELNRRDKFDFDR